MPENTFEAGFAQREYTPEPGLDLHGQMYQRVSEGTRDPLSANAIALRQGDTSIVLVTLDVVSLEEGFVRETQRMFQEKYDIPGTNLLLHATHTHVAAGIRGGATRHGVDPDYVARVQEKALEATSAALGDLESVELYAGCGHLEHMGWNRRAMFDDGSSRMYGHSEQPGFVGLEGPRDPQLPVLFAKNSEGKVKGVLINFASHPNTMENARRYSADYPGEVRRLVSAALGGAGVIYLTGAAGNTAPSILDPNANPQPWRNEEGLVRSGMYMAGEALKVIASTLEPMENPTLELEHTVLQVPMREWPKPEETWYPHVEKPHQIENYKKAKAAWPDLYETNNPVAVPLNVLRIGDAVLCTNPAELFVEFGLAIKEASPAKVTFIGELSDGYVGYVPTPKAFSRGGYETWPSPGSRLVIEAGDQIVEATRELLAKVFADQSLVS